MCDQTNMCNHSTPLWDGALLINQADTSMVPTLLVTADLRSLSARGRAWLGGHDCFHRAPDTPLVPSCMRNNVKRAESHDLLLIHKGCVSMSGPYVSVV